MSAQNHYETLGVNEGSSFEEIQDARDRLLEEFASNRKQAEAVEAAYDAILMTRLRLRQENKIKVPDKIRFAEKLANSESKPSVNTTQNLPEWLKRSLDNPSRNEVLWASAIFLGIAFICILDESAGLALGFIVALFLINRKENRFFRAFLLAILALTSGILLGFFLGSLMEPQLNALDLESSQFAAIVTTFFLWLISSFFM